MTADTKIDLNNLPYWEVEELLERCLMHLKTENVAKMLLDFDEDELGELIALLQKGMEGTSDDM